MNLPIRIELPDGFLDEEMRCGYKVTTNRKKVWAIELDLLNELRTVCEKYNLSFFASGGTLLGAVRHNGFIPWDDDIDIYLMRKDYDVLCEVAPKELKCPYFFQTEKTDPGSARGHVQIRNSLTTGILYSELEVKNKFNQGIFLDVFPVDNLPNDKKEKESFLRDIYFAKRKMVLFADLFLRNFKCNRSLKNLIKRLLSFLLKKVCFLHPLDNPFYTKFNETLKKYVNEKTDYCGELVVRQKDIKTVFETKWFSKITEHQFEFLTIPIIGYYKEFLKVQYGDWEKIIHNSSSHGDVFFDVEHSYTEYTNEENRC